jgi:GT2 family glycosyltransferase
VKGVVKSLEWHIGVRMVNVRQPLHSIADVEAYPRVRVFVADGPDVVGSVEITNARHPISAVRLRHAIVDAHGSRLARRAVERQLSGAAVDVRLPADVPVSVIVPTCDRAEDLRRCLEALSAQASVRPVEIVVVDNRPGRGPAREIARAFPRVTLIEEPRPGLSYARNAGLVAARGAILITTDDDVVAPPDWIERLVASFSRPEVIAVTGNVLPLELESESQCKFEAYGGLGKGFDRLEVNGDWFNGIRGAVPTWRLGATANAAFRASAIRDPAIGLMDEALGAGTPTGCSEDTYFFYRILKAGGTILYEPSVYVWHRHRTSMADLRAQIYSYSKGHVAYQLTTLFREGDRRALVRLGWSLPKAYLRRAVERARGQSDYPLDLLALEILGNLAGPFALWRSRRRVRRLGTGPTVRDDSVRPNPALHDVA